MKFATTLIHAGYEPDEHNKAIMPPVYQNSSFAFDGIGEKQPYNYSRVANPTRQALENVMAEIEQGCAGFAFSTGMAAIDAVFRAFLHPGDTAIAVADIYGGAYALLMANYKTIDVNVVYADLTEPDLNHLLDDKVKLIWLESPTNPLLRLVDIKCIAEKAQIRGIPVCVDNTFATPYLQNPLTLGADIVIHSATKYLGGHSDVMAGIVVTKHENHANLIKLVQINAGATLSPADSSLVLRGIKTLALRMQRHCENAKQIALMLQQHPAVEKTFYPGLSTHEHFQLAKTQMRDFGGVISIYLKNDVREAADRVIRAFRIFVMAASLGGVESMVNHNYTQSHSTMEPEVKQQRGIREGLLRLSIGIEDVEDLKEDLDQALNNAG